MLFIILFDLNYNENFSIFIEVKVLCTSTFIYGTLNCFRKLRVWGKFVSTSFLAKPSKDAESARRQLDSNTPKVATLKINVISS